MLATTTWESGPSAAFGGKHKLTLNWLSLAEWRVPAAL